MIETIEGCLLKALESGEVDAIVHCANCKSTMGSGIAKSIVDKWPQVEEVDKHFPYCPSDRLGQISHCIVDRGRYVINLYGQFNYGYGKRNLNYESFYRGLVEAREFCVEHKVETVGFPMKIGSDRAGGDWNVVLAMIESVFSESELKVKIYKI